MKVPFTWKVTGWFMIGWSRNFRSARSGLSHYFGEDLVAYRDESGELHVLEAHCKHLGAHIGHGGTVVDDCVECPFHGWRWGPDGTNRYIPYQPDRPNRALTLRVFPVLEQYDCVFVWHHPHGKEPQWAMPDIFTSFPQFETDPAAYYRHVRARPGDLRAALGPARRSLRGPERVSDPRMETLVARHLGIGWWMFFFFLLGGAVLEGLHGFKIGWYLGPAAETRRLLWTLAHTHGPCSASPTWDSRRRSSSSPTPAGARSSRTPSRPGAS